MKTHKHVAALAVSATVAVAGWSAGATGTATASSSSEYAHTTPTSTTGPLEPGASLLSAYPSKTASTNQYVPQRGPAQTPIHILAGRGPTRIHTNGHNGEQTKYVFVRRSAQICYNIWGTRLRKGYTIAMWAYVGGAPLPDQQIWARTYYGPKNKTCSPWIKVKGFPVAAAIYSNDGAKATADVWQYWK